MTSLKQATSPFTFTCSARFIYHEDARSLRKLQALSCLSWVWIQTQLWTVIPVFHRQGDQSMCVLSLQWTLNGGNIYENSLVHVRNPHSGPSRRVGELSPAPWSNYCPIQQRALHQRHSHTLGQWCDHAISCCPMDGEVFSREGHYTEQNDGPC